MADLLVWPGLDAAAVWANAPPAALLASNYTGGTTLTLDRTLGATGRRLIGVGVGTTSCELATVSAVSGSTVTLAGALKLTHAASALVEVIYGNEIPAWWFSAVGDATTDDQPPWQQAMDTLAQSGLTSLWVNGCSLSYRLGSPLVRTTASRIRSATFIASPTFTPADTNNAMHVQQNGVITTATPNVDGATLTTAVAHGLGSSGAAFMLQGAALPSGLVSGRVYYACNLTATTLQVASTLALANANTPDITFGTTGSGKVYCSIMALDRLYHDDVRINLGQVAGVNGLMMAVQQPGYSDKLRISSENNASGAFGLLLTGQDYHFRNFEADGAHVELSNAQMVDWFGFDAETIANQYAPRVHVRTTAQQTQFKSETGGTGAASINFWGTHHEIGTPAATTTVSGAGQTLSTVASTLTVVSTTGFPTSGTCVVAGVKGLVSYNGTTATTLLNCTIAAGSFTATNGGTVSANTPYCIYDLEGNHKGIRIFSKHLAWPSGVKAGAFVWVHSGSVNQSAGEALISNVSLPVTAGFLIKDDQDRGEVTAYPTSFQANTSHRVTWGAEPAALSNRTAIANANYTALITDLLIAYTSLTASRTVTLPDATQYSKQILIVKDESGSCSATVTITLSPVAGQTIDGAATLVLNTARATARLYSNGVNWFVI